MKDLKSQYGFSLIEVMVASGIIAFLGMLTAQMMTNFSKTSRATNLKYEKTNSELHLLRNIDCKKSLAGYINPTNGTCVATGNIALRTKKNNIIGILSSSPTGYNIGQGWHYRANVEGNAAGGGITVRLGKYNEDGSPVKNPLNGIPLTFETAIDKYCHLECRQDLSNEDAGDSCGPNEFITSISKTGDVTCEPVTAPYINPGVVSGGQIRDDQLHRDIIANKQISTQHVANFSVNNTSHIESRAIVRDHIDNGAVDSSRLAYFWEVDLIDNSIHNENIRSDSITRYAVAPNAINTEHLSSEAADSRTINSGAIDSRVLANDDNSSIDPTTGTVVNPTAGIDFAEDSITSAKIVSNTISGTDIKNATLISNNIDDGAVSGSKLQNIGNLIGFNQLIENPTLFTWNSGAYGSINGNDVMNNELGGDRIINDHALSLDRINPGVCADGNRLVAYKPTAASTPVPACVNSSAGGTLEVSVGKIEYTSTGGDGNSWSRSINTVSGTASFGHYWVDTGDPDTTNEGIFCDRTQGWMMISCTMFDSIALTHTTLQMDPVGDSAARLGIFFDRDIKVFPFGVDGHMACASNDFSQIRDRSNNFPAGAYYGVYAVCIRNQ